MQVTLKRILGMGVLGGIGSVASPAPATRRAPADPAMAAAQQQVADAEIAPMGHVIVEGARRVRQSSRG